MENVWTFPATVVLLAGLAAAITDIWKYKIYNILTLPLLVSGLMYHSVMSGRPGFQESLWEVLFGLGILLIPHLMGGVGSGDLKLLAGVGAWLKLPGVITVFVIAGLFAALYSIVAVLVFSERRRSIWLDLRVLWQRFVLVGRSIASEDWVETEVQQSKAHRRVVPFAPMIAAAIIATLVMVSIYSRNLVQ